MRVGPTSLAPDPALEFDGYSIDLRALELRRRARRVELSPQAVKLLSVLARRPGELVSRRELQASLWPVQTEVDVDRALNTLIRQVRTALQDDASNPRYIRTYPRRGYRFLATFGPASAGSEAAPTLPNKRTAWRTAAALAVMTVVVAVGVVALNRGDRPAVPEIAREPFELGRHLLRSPEISRRSEAVPYLAQAARLAPANARVHAHLADALVWAGRPADASVEAAHARALDSREPHALFMSGVLALIHEWDWESSIDLLRRAVSRDPQEVIYPIVLAFAQITAGRREEARSLLDDARSLNPSSALLTADIGMMYLYAGDAVRAAELCERAATVDPDADYALDCALAARALQGNITSARAHAVALLGRAGADPLVVLGDETVPADSALARFRRWQAREAAGSPAGSRFQAAVAFAAAGRADEAIRALRQAAARREMGVVTLTVDPRLAALHGDTAFQRLAAQLVARGAAPPS